MLRTQIDKNKILDTVLQLHADEKLQACDKWCLNKAPTGSRTAVKTTALEVKHYSACDRIKATMVLNLRELTCVSGFPSPVACERQQKKSSDRHIWSFKICLKMKRPLLYFPSGLGFSHWPDPMTASGYYAGWFVSVTFVKSDEKMQMVNSLKVALYNWTLYRPNIENN